MRTVSLLLCAQEIVEGDLVHFVGVKRVNGSSGVVRCNASSSA